MSSSFCFGNMFQGLNQLTSDAHSWVEKQIVLAVAAAALDRGIWLNQSDVAVRAIAGSPVYIKRRGCSHYQNSLSFILINTNPAKVSQDIFKDIAQAAEKQYGFAVAPRFSKFRVSISCYSIYRDVVGGSL